MERLHAEDLWYLAPELTLVIAAIALSILDLALPKRFNRSWLGPFSLLALIVSAAFVVYRLDGETVQLLNQSYRIDDFANLFKLLMLGGTAFTVLLSMGSVKQSDLPHLGEYYYLLLPATVGGMIMASSGDLITLFVGLELLSITSYVLVGIRKSSHQANEAAFKYVVLGGIASAFILYGMSFVYGLSGSTNVSEINAALGQFDPSYRGLIYMSFFLMLAGFGFKIAAAPFHSWAADVYQGSLTPIAAYLAVVSKAAAIAMMFRVIYNMYFGVGDVSTPIYKDIFLTISVLAATAMIVGNALALRQRNMKRLLAYSGVANAGYFLVPIGNAFGDNFLHLSGFVELFYYMLAYLFMTMGAFGVLVAVSKAAGHEEMRGFSGLYYRAPYTAVAMVVLLISLAGLPVTGGFFGKFYIILGTVSLQTYWLALIMIATSVMSFYYYFSIIRQMFMRSGQEGQAVRMPWPVGAVVWISVAATLILGFFPTVVIEYLEGIFDLTSDFFIF